MISPDVAVSYLYLILLLYLSYFLRDGDALTLLSSTREVLDITSALLVCWFTSHISSYYLVGEDTLALVYWFASLLNITSCSLIGEDAVAVGRERSLDHYESC